MRNRKWIETRLDLIQSNIEEFECCQCKNISEITLIPRWYFIWLQSDITQQMLKLPGLPTTCCSAVRQCCYYGFFNINQFMLKLCKYDYFSDLENVLLPLRRMAYCLKAKVKSNCQCMLLDSTPQPSTHAVQWSWLCCRCSSCVKTNLRTKFHFRFSWSHILPHPASLRNEKIMKCKSNLTS